jgi:hypothetical protein
LLQLHLGARWWCAEALDLAPFSEPAVCKGLGELVDRWVRGGVVFARGEELLPSVPRSREAGFDPEMLS